MPELVFGTVDSDVLGGGDPIGGYSMLGFGGDDLLLGSSVADTLQGGDGNDVIVGNDGDDQMLGGLGDDVLRGGKGDDLISGNQGDDVINAGRGNDVIFGGEGNDIIFGVKGNNSLDGGSGNDWISTGDQASFVNGGVGDDTILIRTKKGADHEVRGGLGADTFEFVQLEKRKVSDVTIQDFALGEDTFTLDGADGLQELANWFNGPILFPIDPGDDFPPFDPGDDFPFPPDFEGPTSMIDDIIGIDGSVEIQLDSGDSITLLNVNFGDLLDYFVEGPPFEIEAF